MSEAKQDFGVLFTPCFVKSGEDYISPLTDGTSRGGKRRSWNVPGSTVSRLLPSKNIQYRYFQQGSRVSCLFNMPFEERIDTHAHLLPPFYRQACIDAGHGKPDGMPELPVSIPPVQYME